MANILYVLPVAVGSASAGDQFLRDRLIAAGHTVTFVQYTSGMTVDPSYDLVHVARVVSVGTDFDALTKPVMSLQAKPHSLYVTTAGVTNFSGNYAHVLTSQPHDITGTDSGIVEVRDITTGASQSGWYGNGGFGAGVEFIASTSTSTTPDDTHIMISRLNTTGQLTDATTPPSRRAHFGVYAGPPAWTTPALTWWDNLITWCLTAPGGVPVNKNGTFAVSAAFGSALAGIKAASGSAAISAAAGVAATGSKAARGAAAVSVGTRATIVAAKGARATFSVSGSSRAVFAGRKNGKASLSVGAGTRVAAVGMKKTTATGAVFVGTRVTMLGSGGVPVPAKSGSFAASVGMQVALVGSKGVRSSLAVSTAGRVAMLGSKAGRSNFTSSLGSRASVQGRKASAGVMVVRGGSAVTLSAAKSVVGVFTSSFGSAVIMEGGIPVILSDAPSGGRIVPMTYGTVSPAAILSGRVHGKEN